MLRIISDVLDLIYPPRCMGCSVMGPGIQNGFCPGCENELVGISSTVVCRQCAMPVGEGASCPHCQGRGVFPITEIAAMGPFRDPVKRLIHQMKYQHRWPVAETLADRMLNQPRIRELLDQTDVLVAMPLHWVRQIGRGFNQADAVAKRISQKTGILLARPITRVRNTAAQTSVKSRAARKLNVRNAFALKTSDKIAGKRVTLVDDVLTTASTIKAAARVMREADPLCINALVIAIGDPRGRGFETV